MSAHSVYILDYSKRRRIIARAKKEGLDANSLLAQAEKKGVRIKGEVFDATLRKDLTPADLIEAEKQWKRYRKKLLQRCKDAGVPTKDWPQHWGWDWSIQLSLDEQFHGRIGLHSLPQSDDFYTKCGMTCLGPEPTLNYFEMTRAKALEYIKRGA
jgi:hypothetical protein